MTNAKKHRKTKNDTYNNNIFCAIVRGHLANFLPIIEVLV